MSHQNTVVIHGAEWQRDHVADQIQNCRDRSWRRQRWVRRDMILIDGRCVSTAPHRISEGWDHDHCAICFWELFETDDDQHGFGYTDGRGWICCECHDQFIAVRDENTDT